MPSFRNTAVVIGLIMFVVIVGAAVISLQPVVEDAVPDGNVGKACRVAGLNCPEEWSATATPVVPSSTPDTWWP